MVPGALSNQGFGSFSPDQSAHEQPLSRDFLHTSFGQNNVQTGLPLQQQRTAAAGPQQQQRNAERFFHSLDQFDNLHYDNSDTPC